MKKIAIIAAPFGYGPASKALLIADSLVHLAEITLISNGDAYRFIKKYASVTTTCLQGIFKSVYDENKLSTYDYFISVGNETAVVFLVSCGMQSRVIFIDSLHPWRMQFNPDKWKSPVLACLIEDFPGAEMQFSGYNSARVERVAPLTWKPAPFIDSTGKKSHITLALGGVTSPLATWEQVREIIVTIMTGIIEQARLHEKNILVIGNSQVRELAGTDDKDVRVMADVSPQQAVNIISQSCLVISTPGLATIYESILCNVPVLLLPPLSSTALFQGHIYLRQGFSMTLEPELVNELMEILKVPVWHEQTGHCIDWLNRHRKSLLARLPEQMSLVFSSDNSTYNTLLQMQARYLLAYCKNDALQIIHDLILPE